MNSQKPKSVYFLGIGGIGMSSLAQIALARGYVVAGSDIASNENIVRLQKMGINIKLDQSGGSLPDVDLCVTSTAVAKENLDLQSFKESGTNIVHRSEFLQQLIGDAKVIAVSGSHGKTTTTSIIAYMLEKLGIDPTIVVGGVMKSCNNNVQIGRSDFFVIEADESDRSFLNYRPQIIVVNNIGKDHLDVHGSLEGITGAFGEFLDRLSVDGTAILGWDDPVVRELALNRDVNKLSFGKKMGCEVRLLNRFQSELEHKESWEAIVEYDRVKISWPLFGYHNCLNGLAALATAKALGLDINKAAASLSDFPGVSRRLEIVSTDNSTIVVDDYAHNPDKIKAAIASVKERWQSHRIVTVFQPHRFSRLRTMESDFIDAFELADEIVLMPTYSAGEQLDPAFAPDQLLAKFKAIYSTPISLALDTQASIKKCREISQSDIPCVIMSLGAGDVYKVAHGIYEQKISSQDT